jgi:exopolyphosphatase/guanosine-5'-triphosphate,3'-diphosphate pyrophosphatase
MRIAAIDIGTNSIHMVIAQATGGRGFEVVDREREVVQVGSGSFESGRLRPEAMRRTVLALRRFAQLARRHQVDKVLCTTTAAVREAENGGEFLRRAREASGVAPRVIPSDEEGRLIYTAVRSALQLPEGDVLVVDIGGGSMQLALGDRSTCRRVASAPIGALRLTETLLPGDPPAARDQERLVRRVRKHVRAAFRALGDPEPVRVYGSSGAIHALAHVARWLDRGDIVPQVNGHVVRVEALRTALRRLLRMPLAQRQRLPEVDAKRAEIIVAGAVVLLEVLDRAGASAITLSDFGLREGLVTDWLERHAQEVAELEPIDDLRLRSAMRLLTKFDGNIVHAHHIVKLSLELFDGLAPAHGMGRDERDLLHLAALLHDVGAAIAYDGHAVHSAYIIRSGGLRGLTDREVEIIAKVAKYHGKRRPRRKDDPRLAALPKRDRRTVRWLSALLRIAEGLDRSHYQLVRGLRVLTRPEHLTLVADARRDAQLELWAGRRRTRDLARLLGCEVRLVEAPRAPRPVTREAASARREAAQRELPN